MWQAHAMEIGMGTHGDRHSKAGTHVLNGAPQLEQQPGPVASEGATASWRQLYLRMHALTQLR